MRKYAIAAALMGGAFTLGGCATTPPRRTVQIFYCPPGYVLDGNLCWRDSPAPPPANDVAVNGHSAWPPPAERPAQPHAQDWGQAHDVGLLADGAAVGAIAGNQFAKHRAATTGGAAAEEGAGERAATVATEHVAEKGVAQRAAVGVVEGGVVARATPAAVEVVEGEAVVDRVLIWIAERWWLALL